MPEITIAIDGYSSCGKSTVAKDLARKLGYVYVDSGAMYRAVTLYMLNHNRIRNGELDTSAIKADLANISLSFLYNPETKVSDTCLNRENVEHRIRQMDVSESVSLVSTVKEVREKLLQVQRELGKNKRVVMDGRDIGTRVFPDADLKIFMTADTDVRTRRRLDELTSNGLHTTFEEVRSNLLQRDHMDETRKESPLKKAGDAIILDTTHLTREQQLEFIFNLVNERFAAGKNNLR